MSSLLSVIIERFNTSQFGFCHNMYVTLGTWPIQKEHVMPAEMRKELCSLFKTIIAVWD